MKRVICVDLDGTLLPFESHHYLWKRLSFAEKGKALIVITGLFWKGRAWLKKCLLGIFLARHRFPLWPLNERLDSLLRYEKEKGAYLVLVTGSPQLLAVQVAQQVGYFDAVLGSSDSLNLVGAQKAAALQRCFGKGRFIYIGNSWKDLFVWRKASEAWLCHTSWWVRKLAFYLCKNVCDMKGSHEGGR
jgi:phosphoserine phosphatase